MTATISSETHCLWLHPHCDWLGKAYRTISGQVIDWEMSPEMIWEWLMRQRKRELDEANPILGPMAESRPCIIDCLLSRVSQMPTLWHAKTFPWMVEKPRPNVFLCLWKSSSNRNFLIWNEHLCIDTSTVNVSHHISGLLGSLSYLQVHVSWRKSFLAIAAVSLKSSLNPTCTNCLITQFQRGSSCGNSMNSREPSPLLVWYSQT